MVAAIISILALATMAGPRFDDPAQRGAAFKTEHGLIPETYQGRWSEKTSRCGKPLRQDRVLTVASTGINGVPLRAIWAYSDYPAIIVDMPDGGSGERGSRIHLDISQDAMWLRLYHERDGDSSLLRRCPVTPDLDQASIATRERMAASCETRDRDGFIDAFFGSPAARFAATARRVAIIRGDEPPKLWPRRYYRLPPIKFAPHIVYYEYGSDRGVPLKFEPVADADGGFRLEWEEASDLVDNQEFENGSEHLYPTGIRGRLSFKWSGNCWKLVADEIRWTDWPDPGSNEESVATKREGEK